jgi:RNA polymerase sigma-70 factor (ECF subfamily)
MAGQPGYARKESLMASLTDNDLMLQVKLGELDRLGLLFERHKQALFGYFYRRTGDSSTSEDLVQTVFFRILKYRKRFKGYGRFTTWMYSIARNVMVDHHTKRSGNPLPLEHRTVRDRAGESAEVRILKDERLRLLDEAMNQLREEHREILILAKFQDLKYRDIGEILGCTEGAVKVRIFRALGELRRVYKQLEE